AARLLMAKSAQYMLVMPGANSEEKLDSLIEASEAANDEISLAHLYYAAAVRVLRTGGDTGDMERDLRKSLELAERNGMTKLLPAILNALAVRAKIDGDFAAAVDQYGLAMSAYEAAGIYAGVGVIQSNIANIFSDLNDHRTAIGYYEKALAVYDQHMPDNYDLVATATLNMGTAFARLGNYDRAEEVFSKAREVNELASSRRLDGLLNFQNAKVLFEIGDTERAVDLAEQSVGEILDLRDPSEAAVALNWLAERYLERGDNTKARRALERARAIMEPEGDGVEGLLANPGNTYWALEYAREMGVLLTRLGEPDEAAPYYEAALFLGEDRFESEKMKAMANTELLFQLRDRDSSLEILRQNALVSDLKLRQSQLLSWIGLLVALLTGAAAFLIYRSYTGQRQLAEIRETFLKETHHRTKNNLQLLSSLLRLNASRQPKDTRIHDMNAALADRARMMALVNDHLYAFGDEPTAKVNARSFLTDLLDLLQSSLGRDGISVDSNVDDIDLEADKVIPLGLIVSETITNSYKYAFKNVGGSIFVGLRKISDDRLSLEISDTGTGFDKTEIREDRSGLGMSIIDDLCHQLIANKKISTGSDGTKWMFEIPLETNEARP
ncbi:MAG: tetratricopeptide repeat protein, partial [Pseudomonadota bacterium]